LEELTKNYSDFLFHLVKNLRENEILAIHGHFIPFRDLSDELIEYLEFEFIRETLEYPFGEYLFDIEAAKWATKIIYNASQLLVNREDSFEQIQEHIKPYKGAITINAILSADIILRFLPTIYEKLVEIDIEDPLIESLEKIGNVWHYSFLPILKTIDVLDFAILEDNPLFLQIYAEKAVSIDNKIILEAPIIEEYISSLVGIHKAQLL